jgi:hypothetical protein
MTRKDQVLKVGLGETTINLAGRWGSALVRSRFGGGRFHIVRKGNRTLLAGPYMHRVTGSADEMRAGSPRTLLGFRCVRCPLTAVR